MASEDLARLFHETYERLAPDHGYETRKASAVPWDDVPANNKTLMIAVAAEVGAAHEAMVRAKAAAEIAPLIKASRNALDSLDGLIADHSDPGAQALGDRHMLQQALSRAEGVTLDISPAPAPSPSFNPQLIGEAYRLGRHHGRGGV